MKAPIPITNENLLDFSIGTPVFCNVFTEDYMEDGLIVDYTITPFGPIVIVALTDGMELGVNAFANEGLGVYLYEKKSLTIPTIR